MNTVRPHGPMGIVSSLCMFIVLFLSASVAKGQGEGGVEDLPVTTVIGTANGGQVPLAVNAITTNSFVQTNETGKKIVNIVRFRLFEETTTLLTDNFTVSVPVTIEYGPVSGPYYETEQTLTVSFEKDGGTKYNPRSYFSFEGAEYVKVTVTGNLSQQYAGSVNLADVLLIENEMRVTRYFDLYPGVLPGFSSPASVSNPADNMLVNWTWPSNSGHTATELEWTWLENELEQNYYVNGVLNYDLLFSNNATRVELPFQKNSYNIPLFYDGQGKVYYRLRAINQKADGSRETGLWSTPLWQGAGICAYDGHNNALNWQVRTSFAEEGKMKSVMEYYDGSLRSRQTVTKENVNNTTVTAETFYDYEGRPVVQVLPAPGINTIVKYQAGLNLFNGPNGVQGITQNHAEFFDLSLKTANTPEQLYGTPGLSTTSGTSRYYSPQNDDLNNGNTEYSTVPNAEEYPYSVTRYTPDATGRVLSQSGVGPVHKLGSGRETKYYYGTPSQEELDGLFGTEVGNKTHYFKNMVRDANGQMSVSYVDMHGRTIATALAGNTPENLLALDITNPVHYPNQAGSTIIRNLVDAGTNIVKGDAIELINTLLVPEINTYTFKYNLSPDKLELARCSTAVPLCYDCLYDLEISITDESGDKPPAVWKFTNVSLSPDDTCTTGTPALRLVSGNNVTINGSQISFPYTMDAGSYSVRKTLTINEASLQRYKQMYMQPEKGICKTEQQIIDSVYSVLLQTSDCNAVSAAPCDSCRAQIGTYQQFEDAYLASLGNPTLTPELLTQIQAAYNEANENCNRICNTSSQLTVSRRQLMLADMMPYGGQYATENAPVPLVSGSGTTMYEKYNIFRTGYNPLLQPYYKHPEPQNNTNGRYRDYTGAADAQIHPDGTLAMLGNTSPGDFASMFVNKWAESLLPYHPEYERLQYAEGTLEPAHVYSWMNRFNNTVTYQQAVDQSFLMSDNASLIDSFYLLPGTSQMKSEMANWIGTNYAGSGFSLWQIARGQVMCQNAPDAQLCYTNNGVKIPPGVLTGLSAEDKDRVWQAFRNLYAQARDNQLNNFIVAQRPLTDDQSLINQGFQLRFASNNQTAQQYNWSWYPANPGGLPPGVPGSGVSGSNTTQTYQGRCEGYISMWKTQLLECEALAAKDTATRNQILNEITAGMVSVCVRGSDAANPYGSSTVAPSSVSGTLPNSFEQVITAVFAAHSIDMRNNYFCNPYVIEFPKPYGKGPKFVNDVTTVVDSCACANFDSLKVKVIAASGNPSVLSSVNSYLVSHNMDTLTATLHQALLNCSQYKKWVCDTAYQAKVVSCADPEPCSYQCAPRQANAGRKTGKSTESSSLNCAGFQDIVACFFDGYEGGPLPYTYPDCQTYFVQHFNGWTAGNYTWQQIDSISLALCGTSLNVCTSCTDTVMCAVDTNCRWVFNPYYLSVPQPLPDFLKCGGWPPQTRCLTCDSMVNLTNEFKTKFDSPIDDGPHFTGTNLTPDQIEQNILYARFLNFRTGFQFGWMQYAQAAAASNCNPAGSGGSGIADLVLNTPRSGNTPQQYIASGSITFDPGFDHPVGDDFETLLQPNGGGGGLQTVICRDNKPLTDTTGLFVLDTACHRTHILSISLGQHIYQLQQLALQAGFERQYREKCLGAKNAEAFTVEYSNKEYHYTLYYYDMAGSLVKTVPPKGVRPDFSKAYTDQVELDKANGVHNPRPHEMVTQYRYNSLNQVIAQNSPDANTSKFWYDRLGRLVVSQNAQQNIDGKYSYTKYDALGRITEVGQKPHTTPMTQAISQNESGLAAWLDNQGDFKEQITFTVYDLPYLFDPPNPPGLYPLLEQKNLRNRVSYSATKNIETETDHYTATFYTYDVHGNVDTLLQDYKGVSAMESTDNRFKMIAYNYDLISGKVNMVHYQPDYFNTQTQQWIINPDKYFHKYKYDAENRLTEVYTSRDKVDWERDAAYSYYKHGPLRRTVLGQQQVQGIDYAYTIHGWLKGVNGTNAPTSWRGQNDISGDGNYLSINSKVAQDIFGFALHYYDNPGYDYSSIGNPFNYGNYYFPEVFAQPDNPAFVSLYNGNIAGMSVNNQALAKGDANTTNALPLFYNYRYDQLNRIRSMDAYSGLITMGRAPNRWSPVLLDDYKEDITYDPNGNILSYRRNGSPSVPGKLPEMDRLGYNYYAGNNQLRQVIDTVPDINYDTDIDNQANPNNYSYDAIGNLKSDVKEGITNIDWTVYGKIAYIEKDGPDVTYTYDAAGNRITKHINMGRASVTTIYVRDASGNVMSVYKKEEQMGIEQAEVHLYGSSRIGIAGKLTVPPVAVLLDGGYGTATLSTLTRGEKSFELSNHLGNVLAVITDRKLQVDEDNNGQVDYYTADVASANDYYPFGMGMPGRSYSSEGYRYGFNGKENDKDIASGNYDFGARIYDARIGRWYSTDAIMKSYITPYNFSRNNPTNYIDPDGEDEIHFYFITTTKRNKSFALENEVTKIMVIKIVPKEGPDLFYKHEVQKAMNAKWFNKKGRIYQEYISEPDIDEIQEFYPNGKNGKSYASGLTTHCSGWPLVGCIGSFRSSDDDFTSLAKLASPELIDYLAAKDKDKYGHLGMHAAFTKLAEGYQRAVGLVLLLDGIGTTFISGGEAAAARTLSLAEEGTPGAHFFSRHGANTSLSSQYMRAISGATPDGVVLQEVNASKFLTNEGQLEAFNRANQIYSETGQSSFTFDMGKQIGEGYLKGGGVGSYRVTTEVQAVFKDGSLITLFPKIKK